MTDQLLSHVIEALAHADRVPIDELEYSLHDYIDPEALTLLNRHPSDYWELTFEVRDHDVTVTNEHAIIVDDVRFDPDSPDPHVSP